MEMTREMLIRLILGWMVELMQDLELKSGPARQAYHGTKHAFSDVFRVARRIMKILIRGVPESEWLPVLRLMCGGHDLVQEFETVGSPHFKFPLVILRKRKRGPNEDHTAQMVTAEIRKYDPDGLLISNLELAAIFQGISFTYPEWDAKAGTMKQPRLFEALDNNTAHPLAVSLAAGDLLLCGAFPAAAITASDPLLVEECQDLNDLLLRISSVSEISEEVQQQYLEFFRFWDAGQEHFSLGQRDLTFARLLEAYPAKADELKLAFSGFEETAVRARDRAKARSSLTFKQYAEAVGFPVPVSA